MIILILGPQGSGKGTQARLLVEKFGLFYFEAGAFLRELAAKNEKVKDYTSRGVLVPDEEMASYVAAYLDERGVYDNIIFDGFPRTLAQYEFFKKWLKQKQVKLDVAFALEINEDETVKRLSARRQDPVTGKVYNLLTDKPPADVPLERLIQREDDKPEAIKRRLGWYKSEVLPLIVQLTKEVRVVKIDGEREIDVIQKELVGLVEKLQK